jgi:DNA-binding CsgD family transcriptional regulator
MHEDLLERGPQLAALDALLARAAAGDGGAMLIEGQPGIGKTALVGAARQRAAGLGFDVLSATGGELESAIPMGIARQLLTLRLRGAPARERTQLLAGAAAPAATALGLATDRDQTPGAADEGMTWLVAALAEPRPVLVAVDDLQWSDPDSARWLLHLVRRVEELPVAVVLAARPTQPGAEPAILDALRADRRLELLEPGALARASVAALVRSYYAPEAEEDFVDACFSMAGGNPFYTHELLDAAAQEEIEPTADGAAALGRVAAGAATRVVLHRVRRLGDDALGLGRAVAVLGDEARVDDAADLAGLATAAAERAGDALAAEHVLQQGRPLSFVHPLLRAALRESVPAGERSGMHAHAAARLRGRGEIATAAAHMLEVDPAGDGRAVFLLREAAAAAMRDGAPAVAARFLARALTEPPAEADRVAVLAELGRAEAAAGHPEAGDRLLEAATVAARPEDRAALTFEAGWYAMVDRQVERALDAVEATVEMLPADASDLRHRGEAVLVSTTMLRGGGMASRPSVETALESATGLAGATTAERQLLGVSSFALSAKGEVSAATVDDLAERALSGPLDHPGVHTIVGLALSATGRHERAVQVFGDALDEARRLGDVSNLIYGFTWRPLAYWRLGALREAEVDSRTAFSLAERSAPGSGAWMFAMAYLLQTLAQRGLVDEAARLCERCAPACSEMATHHQLLLNTSIGVVALERGRYQEAASRLIASMERIGPIWANPAMNWHRPVAAEALVGLGRHEEAAAIVEPDVAAAARFGAPGPEGYARVALGVAIAGAEGRALVEAGCGLLEQAGERDRLARGLLQLGRMLRHERRPRDARVPLYRALELAEACGAELVVERARTELRAAGARPRERTRSGVSALTASEARVARLAAEGRTNREVAHALFIAPKTVERHLRSAYRKLEIDGRAQLAGALELASSATDARPADSAAGVALRVPPRDRRPA